MNNVKNRIEIIHPRKREQCIRILDEVAKYCKHIIIFGSSTSIRCNRNSDLDIWIQLIDIREANLVYNILGKITDWNFDVIFSHEGCLSRQLKNNIIKQGVCIL